VEKHAAERLWKGCFDSRINPMRERKRMYELRSEQASKQAMVLQVLVGEVLGVDQDRNQRSSYSMQ
jgi:hypothetical protein